MNPLTRLALRRPRLALCVSLLLVALAAAGLPRLELRTDGRSLVPTHSPAIAEARRVRALFELEDPIAVVVRNRSASGIFEPESLALIARLHERLAREAGVAPSDVISLASERSDQVRTGTLDFRPWLDPLPTTSAECESLRARVLDVGSYQGSLLSLDQPPSASCLLVGAGAGADRRELVRRVRALVADSDAGVDELDVVGAPVAESTLGDALLADLARLVPLSLLFMAAIFYWRFRSVWAVLLPLFEVGAALVFTFGCMGWCGTPIYLSTLVLPVILSAVGVADELHVFHDYRRELALRAPLEALRETFARMTPALQRTSWTTALGFLAFAFSELPPVQSFGLYMAAGVLFCLFWTLGPSPATLALLGRRALPVGSAARAGDASEAPVAARASIESDETFEPERVSAALATARCATDTPVQPDALARLARGMTDFGCAHARSVCGAALAIGLLAAAGATRLDVQDSWLAGFSPQSEFRRATERFHAEFGGSHLLHVAIEAPWPEGQGLAPRALFEDAPLRLPRSEFRSSEGLDGARLALHEEGEHPYWRAETTVLAVREEADAFLLELAPWRGVPRGSLPPGRAPLRWSLDGEGRLLDARWLGPIGAFEDSLRELDELGVGRVIGPHELLANARYLIYARRADARRIPDDARDAERVLERYLSVRGEERLRELFDPDYRATLVTLMVRDADFRRTATLMQAVRARFERELAPLGLRASFAGDLAVSQDLIREIVRTQAISLGVALLGIFALALVLWRSLRLAGYVLLPVTGTVLCTFGGMGLVGAGLGVATSMFAGMTIGIGVDFAIHLLEGWRRAQAAGHDPRAALSLAAEENGPAILVDALAVGGAFGLLAFSQVPTSAHLGLLVIVTLASCLVATMVVLPACMRLSIGETLRERAPAAR